MAKKVPLSQMSALLKKEVTAELELEYKAYSFELFGEIVKRTPVDTGRARSNWTITIDNPKYTTSNTTSIPKAGTLDVTGFPDVFIANGLSYVEDLDKGKSKQAPAGIVEPALVAADIKRRR